jgi:hypothetical protein
MGQGRSLGWVSDQISKFQMLDRICFEPAVITKVDFDIVHDGSRENEQYQSCR